MQIPNVTSKVSKANLCDLFYLWFSGCLDSEKNTKLHPQITYRFCNEGYIQSLVNHRRKQFSVLMALETLKIVKDILEHFCHFLRNRF